MNRIGVAIAFALARLGYVIAAALALYMFAPRTAHAAVHELGPERVAAATAIR